MKKFKDLSIDGVLYQVYDDKIEEKSLKLIQKSGEEDLIIGMENWYDKIVVNSNLSNHINFFTTKEEATSHILENMNKTLTNNIDNIERLRKNNLELVNKIENYKRKNNLL